MPKLLSSQEIIRVLQEKGFTFVSQKGSHKKFKNENRIVIVPDPQREIPRGTLPPFYDSQDLIRKILNKNQSWAFTFYIRYS